MTDTKKTLAEKALEEIVDKPKTAENAEGSYTSHSIPDLIKLDEHEAKKEAAQLKPPYGIKSSVCTPGRFYG